ncbi:MAG: DUF1501 domain-containing protein [Chitinophagaceae bacterium]
MKRRDFLKISPALSLPFFINGFPLTAAAENPLLHLLREQALENGRVLVLIQLNGGNDGLNTLIPLDQYSQLVNARGNIVLPSNKVLPLNGAPQTGLHPAMSGIQQLYNNGQVNIVQGVSYPNPSFSHFRSTDIWFTGSNSNEYLNTGWLGRALELEYPGYPNTFPVDPLAVQIGSQASLITQSSTINTAVTVTDPNAFYNLVNGIVDPAPDTPYGHELTFLRLIKQQTDDYTAVIRDAYNAGTNQGSYAADNSLATQLKIVARLIKGGLTTPVYVVSHPDTFDTHANQVAVADTTTGNHAIMLDILSTAMTSFQQDLTAMGLHERVASMTFTEFGRRIKSNDSLGTDHGMAGPVFFFGGSLNPVIIGSNPVIPQNITANDQVTMQYDFRSVYYSVLKDWFQLTNEQLNSVLFEPYNVLPIFRQTALPVKLLSFTGKWAGNKVTLQWDTDQESGIDYYEVQRSDDGNNFSKIGMVSAINTTIKHTYTFNDLSLSKSLYYYRIKIIEKSGAIEFSSVLLLKSNQSVGRTGVKIFPNPVTDRFTVSFDNKLSGSVTVMITDLSGKEVWKQERDVTDVFDINFSFASRKPVAGIYILKLYAKNEEATLKLLVQ